MPYSIQWYIEGQVLFIRFQGVMTVPEMQTYVETLLPFYETTTEKQVHAIIDARYITKSLSLIDLIKVLHKPPHPRMGWNIQVDENHTWMRPVTNVVTQILNIRNRSCNTFDEGFTFLAAQDKSIRWERADLAVLNVSQPHH
jgi:hypothetical protein